MASINVWYWLTDISNDASFANLDETHCTILSTGNKCRISSSSRPEPYWHHTLLTSCKSAAKLSLFDPVDFRKSSTLLWYVSEDTDDSDSCFISLSSLSLTPPVQKIYLSMYCTYNIQTAPFHLYEKQQYGNKMYITKALKRLYTVLFPHILLVYSFPLKEQHKWLWLLSKVLPSSQQNYFTLH